jgi:Uma2 family endonuclease
MSATLTASPPPMTLEQFVARPNTDDLDELVKGRIVPMTRPTPRHGQICGKVTWILGPFADERDLGHVVSNDSGVITERNPDTLRGPDVAFYSYGRLPKGPIPARYLEVVPELVVEVRSPNDRWSEIYSKAGEYLNAGVSIVLVLDDEDQTASIFSDKGVEELPAGADLRFPEILPGFSVAVRRFFE